MAFGESRRTGAHHRPGRGGPRWATLALGGLGLAGCGPGEPGGEGSARVAAPPAAAEPPASAQSDRAHIVFFGDSLTAGHGLEPEQAYPALLARQVEERGWTYPVFNAGTTGQTTSAGLRGIDWQLRVPIEVLVLALGGNDGLRGIPVQETKRNLQGIIDAVQARYPEATVVLAGMQAPPNMGRDFTEPFRDLFPALAKENDLPLIPFLLEGVAGDPGLNQADGIHPNEEGQVILAHNVWQILEPVLASRVQAAEQ